jgi:class 3 adenylate cyclase
MDEEGTHVRLKEHLRVLIDPKIAAHRGHIVKNTGDGLLAEFNSVADAMRCAVDVQRGMAERNSDVPPNNRIEFPVASFILITKSRTTPTSGQSVATYFL